MFRRKNGSGSDSGDDKPSGPDVRPKRIAEDRLASARPRNQQVGPETMPNNPPPGPGFRPEAPRRIVDIPAAPRRSTAGGYEERPVQQSARKLIVGPEISLSGEIKSCDHLVVEGRIEAVIKDCRTIEIAERGQFKGSAEIDEAVIGGQFDGDLVVNGRLTLLSQGLVAGTIRYGELAVEAGGRMIGKIEPLEDTKIMPFAESARPEKPAASSRRAAAAVEPDETELSLDDQVDHPAKG